MGFTWSGAQGTYNNGSNSWSSNGTYTNSVLRGSGGAGDTRSPSQQPERTVPPEATISSKSLEDKIHAHFRGLKKKIPLWQAKQILLEQGYKVAEKAGQLEATKTITHMAPTTEGYNPLNLLAYHPPQHYNRGQKEMKDVGAATKAIEEANIIPKGMYNPTMHLLKKHPNPVVSPTDVHHGIEMGTSAKNSFIGVVGSIAKIPGEVYNLGYHYKKLEKEAPKAIQYIAEPVTEPKVTAQIVQLGGELALGVEKGIRKAAKHPYKTIPGDAVQLAVFSAAGDSLLGDVSLGEKAPTLADQAAGEAPGVLPDDVLNTLKEGDSIFNTPKIEIAKEKPQPKLTAGEKTEKFSITRVNRAANFLGEKPLGGEEVVVPKIQVPKLTLKPTTDIEIYPSVEPRLNIQGEVPRIVKTELSPTEERGTAHFYGHLERPEGDYAVVTKDDLSTQMIGEKPKAILSETRIGPQEKVIGIARVQQPVGVQVLTPDGFRPTPPGLNIIDDIHNMIQPPEGFRDALVTQKKYYEFTTPTPMETELPGQHLFSTEAPLSAIPQEKILNTPHWMDVTEKKYYDIDTGKVIARDKVIARVEREEGPFEGFRGKGKGKTEQWKYTQPKNYRPDRPFSIEYPDELGGELRPETQRSPEGKPSKGEEKHTGGYSNQRTAFAEQAETEPQYQLDYSHLQNTEVARLSSNFRLGKMTAGCIFCGEGGMGKSSPLESFRPKLQVQEPKLKPKRKMKGRQFDNIFDLHITTPKLNTGLKNRLKLGIMPDLSFATDTFRIQKTKQSKQKQDTKTDISVPIITIPDFTPIFSPLIRPKLPIPPGGQHKKGKKATKRRVRPGYLRWDLINPWATVSELLGISKKIKTKKGKKARGKK